jgi:hypothetical protein
VNDTATAEEPQGSDRTLGLRPGAEKVALNDGMASPEVSMFESEGHEEPKAEHQAPRVALGRLLRSAGQQLAL